MIAFFDGEAGRDVEAVDEAFELKLAALPPVVLTEILSGPGLDSEVAQLVLDLPTLEVHPASGSELLPPGRGSSPSGDGHDSPIR